MKKYLLPATGISLFLFLTFYYLNDPLLGGWLHTYFGYLILFFFLQTFPVAWILDLAVKTPDQFPIYVIGAITFRFLTGLFLLLIIYALKAPDIGRLMIQFVGVYLAYMVFELIVVLANLRRN